MIFQNFEERIVNVEFNDVHLVWLRRDLKPKMRTLYDDESLAILSFTLAGITTVHPVGKGEVFCNMPMELILWVEREDHGQVIKRIYHHRGSINADRVQLLIDEAGDVHTHQDNPVQTKLDLVDPWRFDEDTFWALVE